MIGSVARSSWLSSLSWRSRLNRCSVSANIAAISLASRSSVGKVGMRRAGQITDGKTGFSDLVRLSRMCGRGCTTSIVRA